jgi:HEAT repeat protein
LACLQKFEGGTANYIVWLIPYLSHEKKEVRKKTLKVILSIFNTLGSQNQYYESLKYQKITKEDLGYFKTVFVPDDYIHLLVLASFSSNGYVREQAVQELPDQRNPIVIRYLLFRISDWVAPVRESAMAALQIFFKTEYLDAFLKELVTIEGLKEVSRVDLSASYDIIIQFVLSQKLTKDFYNGLKITDQARLIYVRNYLRVKEVDADLIQLLLRDQSFLIRLELLKVFSAIESTERHDLLLQLLCDKSGNVRLKALYSIKSLSDKFESRIIELTSDISSAVRDLARFMLRNKNYDFKSIYQARINKNKMVAASILGLAEVGSIEDLALFEKMLSPPESKIKQACMIAIFKLSPSTAGDLARDYLFHPSGKLSTICADILVKTRTRESLNWLRETYDHNNSRQRKITLKIFSRVGGWDSLNHLLVAVSDPDIEIRNLAWDLLQKWKDKSMRLFTTPSDEMKQQANETYRQTDVTHFDLTPARKTLWDEMEYYIK